MCLTEAEGKKSPSCRCCLLDFRAALERFPWCQEKHLPWTLIRSLSKGNALVWKIVVLLHRHICEIRTSPRRTLFHLCMPSGFPPWPFGEHFGQSRSICEGQRAGGQRGTPLYKSEWKQQPHSRQATGLKKRGNETLVLSLFPTPGWCATSCCIHSLWGMQYMI